MVSLLKCLGWPCEKTFPALDVLRLAVLNPHAVAILLGSEDNREGLVSILFANLSAKAPDACQMLSLRVLSNLFSAGADAIALIRARREVIVTRAVAVLPKENKYGRFTLAYYKCLFFPL